MKDIVNMSFNDDFNGEVPCKPGRSDGRRSTERSNQRRSKDRRSRPRSKGNSRRSKSLADGSSPPKRSRSNNKTGRVTRNPFLNFLREFRLAYWGVPAAQVATLGAKEWKALSNGQKAKYVQQAHLAPKEAKKRRSRKSKSKNKSRSRVRRRRRR